jgi:hypothetical protein
VRQGAYGMDVAGEAGDEGTDKVVAHGGFSVEGSSGELKHDID